MGGPTRTRTACTFGSVGETQTVGSTKLTGAGVLVGVLLGVAEMVEVNVCVGGSVGVDVDVGVSVSRSVGGGVFVKDAAGVSVAGRGIGVEGLSKGYRTSNNRTIAIPINKNRFPVTNGGKLLASFFSPDTGAIGSGVPPSATSSLFTAKAYSSLTKST